jgi:hypothetical protein
VAAKPVEHQQIMPLAVVGAADQRDIALAGLDARMRDPHRVDAGLLLAHEGARGAGDAMHDRDVAGEQVGELRQNSVGRRSLIRCSLRKASGFAAFAIPDMIAESTFSSRSPPPAATIMSMRARSSALPLTPALSSASPAA